MLQTFLDRSPEIHPTAYVHPAAVLIGAVFVGEESSVWPNVTLRGDDGPIRIGSQSSIQDGVTVHCFEGVSVPTIGSRVTVGHNAILHGCTIHDDVLIGMGAVVLDGAVIEQGAIVAAGTLVPPRKIVRAGTMVRGNPMTPFRDCGPKEVELIEYSWRAYVRRAAQYRANAV